MKRQLNERTLAGLVCGMKVRHDRCFGPRLARTSRRRRAEPETGYAADAPDHGRHAGTGSGQVAFERPRVLQ